MVAPSPDVIALDRTPVYRELRRHVREIVGNVPSSAVRPATDRPPPVVHIVVAAGRPFQVTVEMVECDAAFGGILPVVTIQEVRSRRSLGKWIRDEFGLTAREASVARLLARRRSNAEIASALNISPYTARRHTENVMHKLSVRSRHGVGKAIRNAISSVERRSQMAAPAPGRVTESAPTDAGLVVTQTYRRQ
jgi:DNA-binding CsgD family transcriptional regulator